MRLIFCDKFTGKPWFSTETNEQGQLNVMEVAALVAMNCVAHHTLPSHFEAKLDPTESDFQIIQAEARQLVAAHASGSTPNLTPREREVLSNLLQGLGNKEIADKLHLSQRTVKFYLSHLFTKYHVENRYQLQAEAMRHLEGIKFSSDAAMELTHG